MKKWVLAILVIACSGISFFLGSHTESLTTLSLEERENLVVSLKNADQNQIKQELPKPIPAPGIPEPEPEKFEVVEKISTQEEIPEPERSLNNKFQLPANYESNYVKHFKKFELLESRTLESKKDESFKRESLIKVDMKYPYVKVEETFKHNPEKGENELIEYKEFVANHFILQTTDPAVFKAFESNSNISFRKLNSKNHIIEFKDFDLDTVSTMVTALSNKDGVSIAEPDYLVHTSTTPNDTDYSKLWGMHNTGQTGGSVDADIDAPEAWAIQKGSKNIIVAVIDTGIDYDHVDLAANMWKNPGESGNGKENNGIDDDGNGYVDDVYGYDFINDDSDPDDNDHYHGTHCAGTIGGVGNNNSGVAGASWNVQMMAIKFLGPSGGYTSDAILSVEYATANGAHLSSNSWGGGGYSQALKDAIDDAGVNGALFIAAAGNSGVNNDSSPHYPSSYESSNVIAVAATDHNDNLASFSCYGVTSVDMGAPGVSIYSTAPGDTYRSLSGTSMATPHVSGVAALLLSQFPEESLFETKQRLLDSGDSISTLTGKVLSGKRLNAHKALTYNLDRSILTAPGQGGSLAGNSVTFEWSAGNNVSSYRLLVGSTQGGGEFYDTGSINTRSTTVDGLPGDGSPVYVRLFSLINGVSEYIEYTFKAYLDENHRPILSEMTSPENGSTFTSQTVTFNWSEGRQVTRNWLYIGTCQGCNNVYSSESTSGVTVENLPADGRTLYVRLWSYMPDGWEYKDYEYKALYDSEKIPVKSIITSPSNNSIFNSEEVAFTFSEGKLVESKLLYLGSYKGGRDLNYGLITENEKTIFVVPNGEKVYARLWSRMYGVWEYVDYEYTAHDDPTKIPAKSYLTSPSSGTTFTSDHATFSWTEGNLVSRRIIYMGTSPGYGNLLAMYLDDEALSQEITIPTTGENVYVRLMSYLPTGWQYVDYQYTLADMEPALAEITSPSTGSTFTSDRVTFTWNAGVGVKYKRLYVGTSRGSSDIKYHYTTDREGSITVNCPINNTAVYARLYSYVNNTWEYIDYEYTSANLTPVKSEITSPVDGTLLSESEQTFTLTQGVGVKYKWIYIGNYKGGNNIEHTFISDDELEHTFKLPMDRDKVFVRLWSYINNIWHYVDYEYNIYLPEPEGNLAKNFSFEKGYNVPGGWRFTNTSGNMIKWDDRIRRSGKKSIKIMNNNNGIARVISSKWNNLSSKTKVLTLSAHSYQYNVTDGFYSVSLQVLFADGMKQWKHLEFSNSNNSWQHLINTFSFTKDVIAYRVCCQLNYCNGTAWFDDISVESSSEGNLLANGGFEEDNGTPWGWKYSLSAGNYAYWDQEKTYTANRSVKLVNTNSKAARVLSGLVKFSSPVRSFTLSGASKSYDLSANLYAISVLVVFSDNSRLWKHLKFDTGTNDWTSQKETFYFEKDVVAVKPICSINGGTGIAWFDDIAIVPHVFETSSMISGHYYKSLIESSELRDFKIISDKNLSFAANYDSRNNKLILAGFAPLIYVNTNFNIKVVTKDGDFLINCSYGEIPKISHGNDFELVYTDITSFEEIINTLFDDNIISFELLNLH